MITASLSALLLLSTLFVVSTAPLILACLVVFTAAVVSLFTYLITTTSWLSFILLIVFVRAIIVVFVYVASLASNEFLDRAAPLAYGSALSRFLALLTILAHTDNLVPSLSSSSLLDKNLTPVIFSKIYTSYISALSAFLITYLLIALIAVAKTSLSLNAPLRALK